MSLVRFGGDDAAILYSIPSIAASLEEIIRCYCFVQRAAAPSYEALDGCLGRAFRVGILRREGEEYLIDRRWFELIHREDGSAENEIESMLGFEEFLVAGEWHERMPADFVLDRREYDAAVEAERSRFDAAARRIFRDR